MTDQATPEYHRPQPRRSNGSTSWPVDKAKSKVLVVTRGHPFSRDPFFAIFEDNSEIEWSGVEHPAAQRFFTPELAADFDSFVLYDMPGIEFVPGAPPMFFEPPEYYKQGIRAITEAGVPLVVLHHSLAAWPAWPEWAEIVGGQFLYQPGKSRGRNFPDSGYRLDVTHTVSPIRDHPITEGVEPFELVDELYLAPNFEDSITPLFKSNFNFVDTNFFSASEALAGRMNSRDGWSHPPGSNVVGWLKTYRKSPIVYLQFGDGPSAYADPTFRRILANAIRWTRSKSSRDWARAHATNPK